MKIRRKQTEKTKIKIGEKNKGKHLSPNTEFKIGNKNWKLRKEIKRSNEQKNKYRIARAKQVFPKKDTKIEVKIQSFLTQLNIPFLTHQYIEIEHSYLYDILIPSINLVIEIDGDYWHGNTKVFPKPNDWQLEQIEEDKIRTQELIEVGFKVLRLWENEIEIMSLNELNERIKNA